MKPAHGTRYCRQEPAVADENPKFVILPCLICDCIVHCSVLAAEFQPKNGSPARDALVLVQQVRPFYIPTFLVSIQAEAKARFRVALNLYSCGGNRNHALARRASKGE